MPTQMKKWIILISLILLPKCKSDQGYIYFTPQKAASYFKSVEELCNKDNGKIWGKNLYGPLMFVDRVSRKIYANMQDKDGLLEYKDGIYTGLYPKELVLGNIDNDFGSVLFAIVPIPPEEDTARIETRAVSELFKCFQKARGLKPENVNTRFMNQKNARLWVKLEWKALRNAINYTGEARLQALRDALIFRGARRELYAEFQIEENKSEVYEGLANFTSTLLYSGTDEEFKNRLIEQIDRMYGFQSYVFSFGILNGALYSYFLYEQEFDFLSISKQDADLGNIARELFKIELPVICRDVAGSIALNYDIDDIYREEDQRDQDIRKRINEQVGIFIEKPVVYVELESPYFGFEPEDVHSLDTLGTLYTTLRVSDNWGKLTVDAGGCLVSNNLRFLRITGKNIKDNKTQITGDGWTLLLNRDWKFEKVDQNYFIRRLIP
jgi:hypothetical protein